MDKYGVVIDKSMVKNASKDACCPSCGRVLSQPNYCSNCGTKPWEKRKDGKEENR